MAWTLVAIALPLLYPPLTFVMFVVTGVVYGWAVRRWSRPVDVVVVLGAGLIGARVSPQLAARLDRARKVLEQSRVRGTDTRLICAGGQGPDEVVPEAAAMADHLVEAGVDRELIWLEDASTSTEENLRFSANVAADHGRTGPFAVVTNDYHALRAVMLMRQIGLDGFAVGAPTQRLFAPRETLREFFAIAWEYRWLNGALMLLLCVPFVVLMTR